MLTGFLNSGFDPTPWFVVQPFLFHPTHTVYAVTLHLVRGAIPTTPSCDRTWFAFVGSAPVRIAISVATPPHRAATLPPLYLDALQSLLARTPPVPTYPFPHYAVHSPCHRTLFLTPHRTAPPLCPGCCLPRAWLLRLVGSCPTLLVLGCLFHLPRSRFAGARRLPTSAPHICPFVPDQHTHPPCRMLWL